MEIGASGSDSHVTSLFTFLILIFAFRISYYDFQYFPLVFGFWNLEFP